MSTTFLSAVFAGFGTMTLVTSNCGKSRRKSRWQLTFLLRNDQCPGDILVMTAAIESLNRTYPGKYKLAVKTSCDEIFLNNPHIENFSNHHEIHMDNKLVNSSHLLHHFMHNYCKEFERHLDIKLELSVNRPFLYLSDKEKSYRPFRKLPKHYAVINAGRKDDYHTKHYGSHNYQKVVNLLKKDITFVQVGENSPNHYHPPLSGAINFVGKTTTRQLIRLCQHSILGLGPITFLHHLYAALEKPYICLASGFEPLHWEMYPSTVVLSSHGKLPCCRSGGCWKAKLVPPSDSLCELPVIKQGLDNVPQCLDMIPPERVAETVREVLLGLTNFS